MHLLETNRGAVLCVAVRCAAFPVPSVERKEGERNLRGSVFSLHTAKRLSAQEEMCRTRMNCSWGTTWTEASAEIPSLVFLVAIYNYGEKYF